MTSSEIRKMTVGEGRDGSELLAVAMLQEIAAQLSELNAYLQLAGHSIYGKPL